MKKAIDKADFLVSRAAEDIDFRERLLANAKETIEKEFSVTLPADHEIHVHEETYSSTHVVLPPRSKLSEAERKAARTGAASLEFLRKTLSDPAPPVRAPSLERARVRKTASTIEALAKAGRESIRRGLVFLESTIDDNGAWRCIRYNIANPDIPRHFEKPPFVSALCVLALENCDEALAKGHVRGYQRRILLTPLNIPDSGATTAICPRTLTVPRSVRW